MKIVFRYLTLLHYSTRLHHKYQSNMHSKLMQLLSKYLTLILYLSGDLTIFIIHIVQKVIKNKNCFDKKKKIG